MGLFGRRKKLEESTEAVALESTAETEVADESVDDSSTVDPFTVRSNNIFADSIVLEPGTGLYQLVQLMYGKGEGQMTLSLKQNGDDMQLRLYNNGEEVETSVVSPDTDWFAPVAALYTEEEQGERGEWNRALIVVNPPVGDETAVQASFLNTVERTSHNLKYVLNLETFADGEQADVVEEDLDDVAEAPAGDYAALLPVTGVNQIVTVGQSEVVEAESVSAEVVEAADVSEEPAESVVSGQDGADAVGTGDAADVSEPEIDSALEEVAVSSSVSDEVVETSDPVESVPESLVANSATTDDVSAQMPEETVAETVSEDSIPAQVSDSAAEENAVEAVEEEPASSETVVVEEKVTPSTGSTPSLAPAFNSAQKITPTNNSEVSKMADLPEDEKEEMVTDLSTEAASSTEVEEEVELAALPDHIDDWALEDETFDSAPATASAPDVTNVIRRVRVARPSTKKLAEGNLVLSEADVVSRLMPIQEKLFGANGSALDAATVLIRVRTLGSYYDALTHVRRNGFWDQQKTFDLIPEDVLKVLELKTASYKEGSGAPLAMSLRFTPGVPPVASFDYSSEEAFVQYNDQLPAQQYIEELRMFPRTGSNIPAHMSEALASWAL